MASDGVVVLSDEGTNLTDTPRPEAGVPAEPTCERDTLKPTAESAEQDENGVTVCRFFLMGKCHFGHRCRFSHSNPSTEDSGAVTPDPDDKQDEETTEKHKKKVNKASKPKYETEVVNKKPRMRTADDVISRILWDSSVEGSEFVVGYVDRFLGVLERPFNDFNWDTDPCDCDYSSELALPRHRIQYFTYRGHRVWDRHSRTDRVFGSTGQSLAPPFGGEEEVKEVQEQQQDGLDTTEEQPPAVSGQEGNETEQCAQTENKHLEEERQMKTHTSDATQPAPKCRGNTSQEQQEAAGGAACVMEEAEIRPEASTDQMSVSQKEGTCVKEEGGEEAEWKETWDSHENELSCIGALDIGENPSAPLEQREEKRGGRPPKKRPTHFITFRANTPGILSSFQQLQEEVTSLLPSSAPHWQTAASLHVTMCLLKLSGPAEVAAAGEILRKFAHWDRNPPVVLSFPVKLKHFGGKVLYLSPQPQLHLQQLNSGLQEAFRKEGWLHKDSFNPRYHLTLAKVEGREGERVFEGVGDLKLGKGLNFGRLPINTLHLCAMGMSRVDGFYETVCSVTLR
ncbi:leukocyte receptor cluster member 9 [Centropristis striata]|uniref:leukocyte receptor cluster member 9 n=1 Tax=Centropristis striata TaxID=184440 RepID=UPI0027DFCA92|nr:leukocyte receptor cluster member 9 [Centropristis striata]XP_059196036.1 leukocyte receptor cluster member 9 [Centropristis striata]